MNDIHIAIRRPQSAGTKINPGAPRGGKLPIWRWYIWAARKIFEVPASMENTAWILGPGIGKIFSKVPVLTYNFTKLCLSFTVSHIFQFFMRIPNSRPASRGKWKTLAPVARDFSWICRPAAREISWKKHPFGPIICTTFKWGFSLPGSESSQYLLYSIEIIR